MYNEYDNIENQLSNEEVGVSGTLTLILIANFQGEIESKPIETCLFSSVRLFFRKL